MLPRRNFLPVAACAVLAIFALPICGFGQRPDPAEAAPLPAVLQNYQPVTAERLVKPEDGNWLMIRRTYDGWGYSPLTQMTPNNVKQMKLAWVFATGETRVHESAPLVNNGVMFVSTPQNQVIALDAKTGNLLWRYRRVRPATAQVPHDTSRGVALLGDKVYFAAGEAVLVALDAKTGKEVWTTTVADNKSGYYISLAPLVAGGKVMVGASGGEFGIRGFVAAFDPQTGKEQWRTYTVPAPGEPGSETWPKGGNQWKTGGGSIWVTGNYDPQTNLAYWGVGNGGPWMGDQRPGDNLYTASVIALDVALGIGTKFRRRFWWITSAARAPSRDWWMSRATATCVFSSAATVRFTSSKANHSSSRMCSSNSIPKRGAPKWIRRTSPAPGRPFNIARRCGAAKTGRRLHSARKPG